MGPRFVVYFRDTPRRETGGPESGILSEALMNQIAWPLVFAVAGALTFAFATGKPSELGKLAFFAGLLWLVYGMSHGALRF